MELNWTTSLWLDSCLSKAVCKKGVLENFAKFTGKHLCQSLFFYKVAVLRPATLLKKRPWHMCFPVNFEKFLRTPFFTGVENVKNAFLKNHLKEIVLLWYLYWVLFFK